MLTPFMKELNKLLDKHGFDSKMVRTFTVDGPSRKIVVTSYVAADTEMKLNGYRKAIDPVSDTALLTQREYPIAVPDVQNNEKEK